MMPGMTVLPSSATRCGAGGNLHRARGTGRDNAPVAHENDCVRYGRAVGAVDERGAGERLDASRLSAGGSRQQEQRCDGSHCGAGSRGFESSANVAPAK